MYVVWSLSVQRRCSVCSAHEWTGQHLCYSPSVSGADLTINLQRVKQQEEESQREEEKEKRDYRTTQAPAFKMVTSCNDIKGGQR